MSIVGPSAGQSYPAKPIRIIMPQAPGSTSDIIVRHAANQLSSQLAQQVVVDNRPGAGSILGLDLLAKAAPDGYTLGFVAFAIATQPSLYSKLPYDAIKDFQPIILFLSTANMLAVSPSLPIRSVKELIDQARAKPDTLMFGSPGVGTSMHLSMELLKVLTKTNMVHVSYKGVQQAITEVIGGQIHIVCDNIASILPHFNAGRVRGLGVTSLKRIPTLPELPTIDEAGIPGFELTPWGGYASPARTPGDLVLRLNAEFNKVLLSPSMLTMITERGGAAMGGTPEQFAEHIRKETEKWGKVIKAAGIKPQ